MSRIGRMPITVPANVTVLVSEDNNVSVKGPLGTLNEKIHRDIIVEQDGETLTISRPSDNKEHRAMHGLSRTLINNMVVGVTAGYTKTLQLEGTGYRAQLQGKNLVLTVGYSHPVEIIPEEGITFEVPANNRVLVKGNRKQQVGNVAATIRRVRPPEPYHGKGIRYEGERVRRKEGKAGSR